MFPVKTMRSHVFSMEGFLQFELFRRKTSISVLALIKGREKLARPSRGGQCVCASRLKPLLKYLDPFFPSEPDCTSLGDLGFTRAVRPVQTFARLVPHAREKADEIQPRILFVAQPIVWVSRS
jgi:hypothetical protein